MRSDLCLAPLREQIRLSDTKLLEKQLGEFRCKKDRDVESFLHEKAIRYERSGLSRTYLYLTGEVNTIEVAAYFSIAVTSVDYVEISRNKRQEVLGGTPGRDSQNHFGGLLIAQLARDDNFSKSAITGAEIIEDCEEVIRIARDYIGGRAIYLDCRKELIDFYTNHGYSLLKAEPFVNGLYKMVRVPPRI
jgi:hypothetical protein